MTADSPSPNFVKAMVAIVVFHTVAMAAILVAALVMR